ncbi:protocadherin-8-like [Carcharodon carcharias]|uniref:protocadherin-8-like n=1 Tax=Carcharodon carcharias TaxID=13397 RepID=UPI001B7F13F0|nr:protocadherin-8-like [Carcharodon carcharias]
MTSERDRGKFAAPVCSPFNLCSLLLVLLIAPISDCKTAKYSTYEEELPGTVIGNLAADLQLNAAAGGPSGFRLMQKSNWSLVQVGESDGQLMVGERIDREQLCQGEEPCLLVFDVVNFSREKFLLIHVEIEVKDINDNAPQFAKPEMSVEISESSALGTRLPLEPALDADVGANYLQNYQLSANSHFELEVQSRADGVKCAQLVLVQELDRETAAQFSLELRAQDGGRPPRTGTAQLQVRVLDSNDNRPAFEQSSFLVELDEDAPLGSVLLELEAVDPDEGLNGEVVYGFGPAVPADVRRLFRLDAQSGRLTLEGPLDHESRPSFELDVEAQDLGANPARSGCKVTVRVLDINDNAPEISITPMASSSSGLAYITEAAAKGSFVALVSTSDRDSGHNGRVSCTLYGHQHFQLRPAYGSSHMIVTAAALDREREAEYNLTVVAEDQGPAPHKTIRPYTIRVGDENDNAPSFSRSVYRVSLLENNQPGAYITTVLARDPDLGLNGRLTYRLLEPASARLATIDPATGAIYALRSFDRESLREAELRLQATDGGFPPLSSSTTVSLRIADRNDNAPLVTQPLHSNGSAADVITLPGHAPSGYLATRVRARDADEGLNAKLSYRIVSGEQAGLFTIRTDTGEIYLGRPLTPPTGPLRLIVAVSDSGRPPLSATVTLSFTAAAAAEPRGGGSLVPGKRSWDTSFIIIVVLAGGCVALLMAIIGVAATCNRGGKAAKCVANASVFGVQGHLFREEGGRREESGDRPARSSELEAADLAARNEMEVDRAPNSEGMRKGIYLLEADHKVGCTIGESFMTEPGLNHGTFCAVVNHQDRKTLTHPGQDIFSGKDSGKGDSDFNDSDSDISGVGVRKGNTPIDQRQNGLFPCREESQQPCSSDPHYNLTSQMAECSKFSSQSKQGYMVAYSSIPAALLHSPSGEVTSALQDHALKYTQQCGHLPKSGPQTSERVLPRESGRTVSSFHPSAIQRHNKTTSSAHGVSGHRYQTSYLNTALSEVATSF